MNDENEYQMVARKRKWCPEWLFAIMSWPVDMVSPKWLPFRWMLTKPEPKFVRHIVKCPPLKPGQDPSEKAVWIPVTVDKKTGEDLLTEEAIRRIDMCKISMSLEQLRETVRELTGFYK